MKRAAVLLLCLLMLACAGSNAVPAAAPTEEPTAEPTATPTAAPVVVAEVNLVPTETPEVTPVPSPTPTPSPEPTETPNPEPIRVTIGAVGDIMIPSGIVSDVKMSSDVYDFSRLFAPVAELFQSVDLMCANMEAPLAGAAARYSAMAASGEMPRFNAPDSVLDALRDAGMDLLTTANNHILDKELSGLKRTTEVIRAAGFYQTGTYLDEQDRTEPCVIDVNGIRVGFIAATRLINRRAEHISTTDLPIHVCMLVDGNEIAKSIYDDIARCKEAGAEFIILFPHWDYEDDKPAYTITKQYARELLEAGVDAIIGSHPHNIKRIEYVTVTRDGGEYTGLVAYSLGNFTANQDAQRSTGLFLKLTLEKDPYTGAVTLCDATYLPTLVMRRTAGDKPQFAVFPAYADRDAMPDVSPALTDSEWKRISTARSFAVSVVKTDQVPVM